MDPALEQMLERHGHAALPDVQAIRVHPDLCIGGVPRLAATTLRATTALD